MQDDLKLCCTKTLRYLLNWFYVSCKQKVKDNIDKQMQMQNKQTSKQKQIKQNKQDKQNKTNKQRKKETKQIKANK